MTIGRIFWAMFHKCLKIAAICAKVCAGALILVAILMPALSRPVAVSPWIHEMMKLKGIYSVMTLYESDHEMAICPEWKELAESKYWSSPEAWTFKDPETGKSLPWLYFAQGKPNVGADGPTFLVAAAPVVCSWKGSGGKVARRMVLWSNGSAETIDETEFQALRNAPEGDFKAPASQIPK